MQARRYLTGLTLLGVLLAAVVLHQLAGGGAAADFLRPIGGDFVNVWAAPQLPLGSLFHTADYMPALQALFDAPVSDHNWSYPLYCLWLFAPFSALPYPLALALWTVAGIAAMLCAARMALARPLAVHEGLALLLAPAGIVTLYTGQNGFFTAALALLALTQLEKHPYRAGLFIGLLCLKPHLGLLWPIALLSIRAWRSLCAAALTVLALAGLSFLLHGAAAWEAYFTTTAALQWSLVTTIAHAGEPCCFTYHLMMVGPLPALRFAGVALDTAILLQAGVTLIMLVLCYRYFPRLTLAGRAVLLGAGTLLALPYGYNYDLMLLMAGLLLHWHNHPPQTVTARWVGGAAYLSPLWVYLLNSHHLPLVPVALALCLCFVLPREGAARTGPAR